MSKNVIKYETSSQIHSYFYQNIHQTSHNKAKVRKKNLNYNNFTSLLCCYYSNKVVPIIENEAKPSHVPVDVSN